MMLSCWVLSLWYALIPTTRAPPSLFAAQRPSTYSQGNMGKFRETRGGVGKSGVLEHKSGNISETRKGRGRVTMEYGGPIGSQQRFFERYHPRPPTASSSPRLGFATPPKIPIAIISGTDEATSFKFGRNIHRIHPKKSLVKGKRWHMQGLPKFLECRLE